MACTFYLPPSLLHHYYHDECQRNANVDKWVGITGFKNWVGIPAFKNLLCHFIDKF